MRIAIFTETFLPKWDGIANTLCYLLEHLAKRGHECIMFAPEGAPPQYAETKIIGLPSFAFPLYPDLKLVPPVMNVAEELDAFKPDLVHLVNLASLGLVGMRHARERDLPVAASYHTDLPGYTRLYGIRIFENTVWTYFRWLHNQADLNFCPSTYTKTELANHGFERLAVWGRGVDTEHYSPKHRDYNWRVKLTNGAPESTLLLYTGRLAMEKRIDWVRPVMDLLPDIRFAVVGDGPLREELEEKFAGTHTVFTGYLRGDDLARAYAAGDIFVFPSPSETFGNVVLEAMASGMPVVAAGAGGPVDHVFHKQNGMISDPEDPADFVALVWELATNKPLATKLAANARAYAESQTWDMILDKLIADWAKLLKDYHAKPGNRAGSTL